MGNVFIYTAARYHWDSWFGATKRVFWGSGGKGDGGGQYICFSEVGHGTEGKGHLEFNPDSKSLKFFLSLPIKLG